MDTTLYAKTFSQVSVDGSKQCKAPKLNKVAQFAINISACLPMNKNVKDKMRINIKICNIQHLVVL